MNQRQLKATIRALATVAGLFGILDVFFGIGFLISSVADKKPPNAMTIFFATMFVIPGIYLSWVLFLVWRRFSPKAVLHFCGAIGFFAWVLPGSLFDRIGERYGEIGHIGGALASLFWLLWVIAGYRSLNRYLFRRLFEREISAPQPV
jgi:hypothetical protein